jgi:hypothetical protein
MSLPPRMARSKILSIIFIENFEADHFLKNGRRSILLSSKTPQLSPRGTSSSAYLVVVQ